MKKLFAVLLALTLVLSMGTIALAADGDTTATGSITISNALKDATYNIYKMFDFTPVEGSTTQGRYTVVAGWEDFLTGAGAAYLKTNAETGTIEWNGEETNERKAELAKAAIAYAKQKGIAATATQTATADGAVTFDGVALGYYAIDTSLGTVCALTNVDNTFEAHEKNEKPKLEKKIVEGDTRVDANNVAIGDTVTYEATITIGVGAQNYVMHDKMSDTLEYTGVTSITVDGIAVDEANYTIIADPADDCTFEVEFKDSYTSTLDKGTKIVVTYTAELKDNAIVGAEGNPNEAWLEYGDEHETIHDYVITYTTKFVVDKVDGDDKALTGAEFTLSKLVGGSWVEIDTVVVDATGTNFTWNGLSEGQYKLEETVVPEGFNKAADIEFIITCEEPVKVDTAEDTANWSDNSAEVTEENETFKAKVVNKTGSLLPETGGIGTTIFYVVGSILMLAALVLLVSKKRMASFA